MNIFESSLNYGARSFTTWSPVAPPGTKAPLQINAFTDQNFVFYHAIGIVPQQISTTTTTIMTSITISAVETTKSTITPATTFMHKQNHYRQIFFGAWSRWVPSDSNWRQPEKQQPRQLLDNHGCLANAKNERDFDERSIVASRHWRQSPANEPCHRGYCATERCSSPSHGVSLSLRLFTM